MQSCTIVDERSNKAKYIDLSLFENPNQRVRQPFTTADITLLWQNQPNIQYIDVILMLIYTGVRISELLNLKKADVNLSERFFSVTASKTDAGIRTVPIADKVLPFFQKWYDLNNSDYLISMNDSKPFKYRNFYDAYWSAIMQQFNMKHTPHDTRHTFISLMTQKEVDERLIQQIVGHKGTSVTTNVYTHIDILTMLNAVNLI